MEGIDCALETVDLSLQARIVFVRISISGMGGLLGGDVGLDGCGGVGGGGNSCRR